MIVEAVATAAVTAMRAMASTAATILRYIACNISVLVIE